jgi:hypothetical protein
MIPFFGPPVLPRLTKNLKLDGRFSGQLTYFLTEISMTAVLYVFGFFAVIYFYV